MPMGEGRNVARKICEYQIAHKVGDNPYWTSNQMLTLFTDLDAKDEEIAKPQKKKDFFHDVALDNSGECEALREHIVSKNEEIASLRSEVREWVCASCNLVYPGPPQVGVSCVVCPRCGGDTMPKPAFLIRKRDAEINRITALNTQQARRMVHLTVLAVGCDKHPAYRRKRPPTWPCETCKLMWEADRALKQMATANQIIADVAEVLHSYDSDEVAAGLRHFVEGFAAGPDEEEKSGG